MRLNVRIPTGRTVTVYVAEHDTCGHVLRMLRDYGGNALRHELTLEGMVLDNARELTSYDINPLSVSRLTLEMVTQSQTSQSPASPANVFRGDSSIRNAYVSTKRALRSPTKAADSTFSAGAHDNDVSAATIRLGGHVLEVSPGAVGEVPLDTVIFVRFAPAVMILAPTKVIQLFKVTEDPDDPPRCAEGMVEGMHAYNAEQNSITFSAFDSLHPSSLYTAVISPGSLSWKDDVISWRDVGGARPDHAILEECAWTFHTLVPQPVRLPFSVSSTPGVKYLITLQRRTGNAYDEVRVKIAAKLRLVRIEMISAIQLAGNEEVAICDDEDVLALTSGDELVVRLHDT